MTRVCLVGAEDVTLRYELLSRETAREALSTYDLSEPFVNTVAVETVSLGAAVSLLNDLNWYLVRFAADAFVLEPSVSRSEWLSRDLAAAVRDGDVDAGDTDRFLRVYGVVESGEDGENDENDQNDENGEDADSEEGGESRPALVEPMFVTRTGDELPAYDLREVSDTLVVRVTESEFGA
jgi:hypothetical protein